MYRRFLTYYYEVCFCGLLTFSVTNSIAQTVTETVNFDNYTSPTDNDLANKFSSAAGLTQITSNGITGGALNPPSYIEWGDDRAIYQSKYKSQVGSTSITSISFKYNASLVNPNNDQKTASIWLIPESNPDHYHVATIERNKTLGLLGYQHASAYNVSLNLLDDHWYKLQLSSTTTGGPFGDRIDYEVTVVELGLDGTSTPASIGSVTGTLYDIKFTTEKAISVAFSGTKWGGASLLDDFSFNGQKNTMPQIRITSPFNNSTIQPAPGVNIEITTTPTSAVDSDGDSLAKTIVIYKDGVMQTETTVDNDQAVYHHLFFAHSSFKIYATLSDGINQVTMDSVFVTTDNSLPDCKLVYPQDGGVLSLTKNGSQGYGRYFSPVFELSPPGFSYDQDNDPLSYSFEVYTAGDSLLYRIPDYYPNNSSGNIYLQDFDLYYFGKYETSEGTEFLHPPNIHEPLKIMLMVTDQFEYCYSVSNVTPNILEFTWNFPKILSPLHNQMAVFEADGHLPLLSQPFEIVDIEGDTLYKGFHVTGPSLDTLIVARNRDYVYLRKEDLVPGANYSIVAWLSDGYDTITFASEYFFETPLITSVEDRTSFQSIYPNPFETEIMLAFPTDPDIVRIRILDLVGRVVLDQQLEGTSRLHPNVSSGTYVLEAFDLSGRKKLTRRIIKK